MEAQGAEEPLLEEEEEEAVGQVEEAVPEKPAADQEGQQKSRKEWREQMYPTIVSILILWMLKMVQQVSKTIPIPCATTPLRSLSTIGDQVIMEHDPKMHIERHFGRSSQANFCMFLIGGNLDLSPCRATWMGSPFSRPRSLTGRQET